MTFHHITSLLLIKQTVLTQSLLLLKLCVIDGEFCVIYILECVLAIE